MQLRFGPDDDDAFAAVKQQLLDEFRPWVANQYGIDDGSLVADAETFLTWRFDYSTGDLTSFSLGDVEEFLLVWAPRKFAVGPEEAPVLCRSVQAMVEFLAATDRLDGGASRAAKVMMRVDELVDDVADALGDDSKFGMGKSFASAALSDADGNPLADLATVLGDNDLDTEQLQAILDERMAAFNSLPFEERREVTDSMLESPDVEPMQLPFTYVAPPLDEVERSARESRLLQLVDAFVEFVGDHGAKLTGRGNIATADARRLVEVLDTGDVVDVDVTGRPSKMKSSTQLRWLTLVDDVATFSGAVERDGSRLVVSPGWATMSLVDRGSAMTLGLLEAGPLQSRIASWDEAALAHRELLDDGIAHWLSAILPAGSLLDYSEVEELAFAVTAAHGPSGEQALAVPSRLSELFEVLEFAGLVQWHDRVTRPGVVPGWEAIVSGEMSLTPLGRYTMADPVRAAGYAFPALDDLGSADGLALVNAVVTGSIDVGAALESWRPDASVVERAHLLADAAIAAELPEQRLVAFTLFGQIGVPDEVAPILRELLDTHCAGHAATFLLEHGLATESEVGGFMDVGPMVDMLRTVIDDPANLNAVFDNVEADVFDDLIDDMWRHHQPETIEVLEGLGKHLTDRQRAKNARRAANKHRSWLANQ